MAPNAVCCTMVPFLQLLLLAVELDKAAYYHLYCCYDIYLLSHSVLDATSMFYSLENEAALDLKSTLQKLSPRVSHRFGFIGFNSPLF